MLIDPPVGTPEERATGLIWPGEWFDATPFASRYLLRPGVFARHTGADLNLNKPTWNLDANAPVYAIADGIVTSSRKEGGTWGWVIVIEHQDDDGNFFYSRYAHVNHIQFPVVRKNDMVTIGKVIAHIGNADGIYGNGHHLHFDISHTKTLKTRPAHWPGDVTAATIRRNYSDPHQFIFEKRNAPAPVVDADTETMKVNARTLWVRPQPNTLFAPVSLVRYGDTVEISGSISGSGYHFAKLHSVNGKAIQEEGYVAREYLIAPD